MARLVVLSSWKEIAQFMGRSCRTVQRWERDFGLPVHRPSGKRRSAVIAMREEIEDWVQKTPMLAAARKAAAQIGKTVMLLLLPLALSELQMSEGLFN